MTRGIEDEIDDLDNINSALLIGLAFYGEFIERRDVYNGYKLCGKPIPDGLAPLDPDGRPDVTTIFATALQIVAWRMKDAQEKTRVASAG